MIDEPNLQFRYQVVDIREMDCQLMMDSPALEENMLAILCRMENEQETIQEILRRISQLD
ncbi:MAG: hypothetical protein HQM02_11820 [Magnetococcales bacterium]|nr:hypothetical protein [Magnetococcales bacterium]